MDPEQPSLLAAQAAPESPEPLAPLADRMRPRTLDEIVGQTALTAEGAPLRAAIASGQPHSLILWGPPGSGKTTLLNVISSFIPEGRLITVEDAAELRLPQEHVISFEIIKVNDRR